MSIYFAEHHVKQEITCRKRLIKSSIQLTLQLSPTAKIRNISSLKTEAKFRIKDLSVIYNYSKYMISRCTQLMKQAFIITLMRAHSFLQPTHLKTILDCSFIPSQMQQRAPNEQKQHWRQLLIYYTSHARKSINV